MVKESAVISYVRNGVPYNKHRQRLVEFDCEHCRTRFLCPATKARRFCSPACSSAFVVATGYFSGDNNPRWLGGVSNDNMRYRTRQKERWPEKELARKAVRNALKRGQLKRTPCEKCGEPKSEGHHDDYSKPLEVRWLCRRHHIEHHKGV